MQQDLIKCLIIDDEPLASDLVESFAKKIPDLEVVRKINDPLEALNIINQGGIDLIFLDIEMPNINGVQFVKSLNTSPHVIFTTAYSDYALEGYELNVIDYLLKPFSFGRFLKAANKAIESIRKNRSTNESEKQATSTEDFMFVKADKKITKIKFNDIYYIEAMQDYVRLFLKEDKITVHGTLKKVEEKLAPRQFIRVHRSYIISLNKIDEIVGNIVRIKGNEIPIGLNYKEKLEKAVNDKKFL